MFKNREFKEVLLDNLLESSEFADFIFDEKGERISELLKEAGIIEFPIDSCPENVRKWFEVQQACCYAYYDKFVENAVRKEYDDIVIDKEIESQINTIRKLQKFNKEHPNIAFSVIKNTYSDLSIDRKDIHNFASFNRFLDLWAAGLQNKLDQLTGKIPLEEKIFWPYGGLLFTSDLPFGRSIKRQGDIKRQSLLFHLAYVFRHITSNKLDIMEFPIGPMPKLGKPCYDLVGKIAQVVLDESVTQNSAQKTVNNLVKKDVWYFDPMYGGY